MDFDTAMAGTEAPREVLESLCLIEVDYLGFDGYRWSGQLVIHRDLAAEIEEVFALMQALEFPVGGVVPIVRYGWSDEASMAADNSSAFNYRKIAERTGSPATPWVGRWISTLGKTRRFIQTDGSPLPERSIVPAVREPLPETIRWFALSLNGAGAGGGISIMSGITTILKNSGDGRTMM
ncbi:MAG: hypothetical protein WCK00_17580 [Deltaproteobacteria bacterium]